MTINAGNTGDDIINVDGFGSGFSATVTVDGQGGTDTINWGATAALASLDLRAETVNLNSGTGNASSNITSITGDLAMDDATVTVIEIGGLVPGETAVGAGDGYDQINVTEDVVVDGSLQILLINGFTPSVGDEFEILTYGSSDGLFDEATGLFGFGDGSLYFEVAAGATALSLTVQEFGRGEGDSFLADTPADADNLGEFLNSDYFQVAAPSLVIPGSIQLAGFVNASGAFSFTKSQIEVDVDGTVLPADDITMNVVLIAASDVSAFVGIDGPYHIATGTSPDAKGFVIDALDLGVVLASPTTFEKFTHPELFGKKYTTLAATASGISFVGFDDDFKLEAADLSVGVNVSKGGVLSGDTAIDWASSFPSSGGGPVGYELSTGGDPVFLDFDKKLIRASTSSATLEIGDFVHVSGAFGFEKSRLELDVDGTVFSADDVTMNVLQVSASNVSAFVGIDGPYGTNPDAKGFVIDDLDLGVVLASPTAFEKFTHPQLIGKTFKTLAATANEISVVGFGDDFKLEAEDLAVGVNISSGGLPEVSAIDWTSSFPASGGNPVGYELQTGGDPVRLDFDRELIRASTSSATLEIGDFVHVSGAFGFETSRLELGVDGTVFSADDVTMNVLQVSASNVTAFVGIDGPYHIATGTNPDAKGFVIDDLDLGVALASPTIIEKIAHPELIGKNYTTLAATANEIRFVGFGDDFKLEAEDLAVGVNISSGGLFELSAIDWASSFLASGGNPVGYELQTGGDPVRLDFDRELLRASTSSATLQIGGFVYVNGAFGFEKSRLVVDVDEGIATADDVTMDALVLGASNVSAFIGINGPYFTATGTNSDAVGLAIDNLDLGLALLAPTPSSLLLHPQLAGRSYTALKANVDHAYSVGFGDVVTIEADYLDVSANFSNGGLISGATAIDWDSSFPGVGGNPAGLEVETGGDPVYLDAEGPLLAASGDVTVNVLDVVKLDGVFDFELSTSQIFAFVDGAVTIGPGGAVQALDATGLLVLDKHGLGLNVDVTGGTTLVGVVSLDAELQMLLNTSGQQYNYEVPEQFQAAVGFTELIIPAGAPRPDGSEADPGFYAVLDGTGSIGVMGAVDITGDIYFAATENDLRLTTTGSFSDRNDLIPATAVAGDLIISDAGLVGSLSVAAGASLDVFNVAGFGLTGQFQLEMNSTSSPQEITVLNVSSDGSVDGTEQGTIAANTIRMSGGVALGAGPFAIAGVAELVFSDTGFQVNLDAGLDLLGFGIVDVVGQAAIIKTAAGPVFAADIAVDVEVGIDQVNLGGKGKLLINTSLTDSYLDVSANTFLVNVDGTLQILLFNMDAEFTISSVNGVFRTEINNLGLNFFNFQQVNVSGYVQSDGKFEAVGTANFGLDMGPAGFTSELSLSLSDQGHSGHLKGTGGLQIGLPWPFSSLAGGVSVELEGDIELGIASASIALTAEFMLSITIDLGFFDKTFSESFAITGDFSWSFGAPPIIARQEGDTVYLNIGDVDPDGEGPEIPDGDRRGELYKSLTSENYTITRTAGALDGHSITVQSLGQTVHYTGVNRIVARDAGERSDFIYIGPGVSADAELHGGPGNDSLTYLGSGKAFIYGDEGNDLVRGGQGSDELDGGPGTDFVDGQDGNDLITVSSGFDTVLGGRGDDRITVWSGNHEIFGGPDDDTVIIRGGKNTVYGESGDDLLSVDYSNLSIGQTTFVGGIGSSADVNSDSIDVAVNSNGNTLQLNDQSFTFGNHTLNFDDTVEAFNITDSAASTRIGSTNAAGTQWGATVLSVNATEIHLNDEITANGLLFNATDDIFINVDPIVDGTMGDGKVGLLKLVSNHGQLDFTGQEFHVANGHLVLSAAQGFTDTIRSEARALTTVNRGTGSAGNITVREADDLIVLDGGLASGGVYSQHGAIDIELDSQDSLLTLSSGIISTSNTGQTIQLTADDFDFTSGENTIAGTGDLIIRSTHDDINYRVGSAGENSVGEDQSTITHDVTAYLGVVDFAAMDDEFSLVRIGHANVNTAGVCNEMTFGDIEDNPVIKTGPIPRIAKAALRNWTQFFADTMTISGDVQAPVDRLEFHAHRATINSKNLHEPLGADDSGVTTQSVLFALDEQLQHGGWIVGLDRIDIDVLSSDGTRPYFSFPDELVSVKSDVGSVISTVNPNSVIDVNANQSIQIAGMVEVHGANARLNLAADTKLTVLQGGVVSGGDDDNVVTLDAGLLLSVNPGGAVIAGARFDDVNGTPVAVQTGVGADAILNSPHELFIGGTVTTSDEMQLNSGSPQFDHTDYFNGLPAGHPLIGLSEYGLLLTGTLTTLAADSELKLTSDADIIVRGNVNVLGANSDLLIQSDRFVYIEGFLDVKDNARILGGVETDGTIHNDAPPVPGSSVYVATTSRIVTRDAGSSIEIHGAQDVDLFGAFVAGGTIGSTGVTFTGPSSSISVTAGEQVFLDTGLLASGTITVDSGTPGADDTVAALFPGETLPGNEGDDLLSLVVTTAGGITTEGETTDGSGGGIVVNAAGNIELLGRLTAGASVTQQFDSEGKFLGDTVVYSNEPAALTINTTGRANLGGHTFNEAGDIVQTGTVLRSAHSLTVHGGSYPTGEGLLVHAASELTTNDPDGSITLTSEQQATWLGLFVAGGRIDTVRDTTGGFLGRIPVYFGGDSEVTLQAGGTIEIGQDIVAGGLINLIGGTGVSGSGPGLTLQGSGRLYTLEENSQINLNAPGEIVIQAPGHINEIEAQGFTVSSLGQLTADVVLAITVDRVDFTYAGTASLTAAATADNSGIADLVADLQAALEAGNYTIATSNDPGDVGNSFTEFPDDPSTTGLVDPDITIKLRNGKLLLTSPYDISINDTSVNSLQLGVDVSGGSLNSSRLYAIDAAQPGSTVSIGAANGPNGKLSIGGKVRAHSTINLYSGTSPDGIDIDFGPTGILETVDGSIDFSAGEFGDTGGTIIANGAGSDIVLDAEHSLRIRGSLTADNDILLSAGSQLVEGEVSVQIDGTSQWNSYGGGGRVVVTGYDDVVFDGVFGTGSHQLALLELNAEHGNLTIPKTSGRIESDGLIALKGAVVDVQGVVRSTLTTADPSDYEITIDASDTAIINGDFQLTGSLLIDADILVDVFNTSIDITEPNQRVRFSGGHVRFGKPSTDAHGDPEQLGVVVTAVDRIEFDVTGLVEIGSGSIIATSGDNSVIEPGAGSLQIAGSLLAGASVIGSSVMMGPERISMSRDATP